MDRALLTPVILMPLIGLVLILLGYLFDHIKPFRQFAPLCRFMCFGVILGCAAGLMAEFAYDFIERWLSRNLPRSLARVIDVIYDLGYARILGTFCGAAAAVWFWCIHRERLRDIR